MPTMKLTKPQIDLLLRLADGRQHEVREYARGFSGYITKRGARETTLAALKDAGLITTDKVWGSDTYRGYTRRGYTEYAELTPEGRAFLAGLEAR